MIEINREIDGEIPEFTAEERARIDRVFRALRRKYDPVFKAGVRWRPKPKNYDYLADKKLRDAEIAAGLPRRRP